MAGMQRFVTYIYAYEEGRKSGNTGYAKIETRDNEGRMEIHFMNAGVMRGVGQVSFVFIKDGKIVSVPIGELPIERGTGMANITFQTEDVGESSLNFNNMDGVCIVDSNQRRYFSFWHEIRIEEIKDEMLLPYTKPESEAEQLELPKEPEHASVIREETQQRRQEVSQEAVEDAEQESLHTMEIPVQNVFPTYDMTEIWEQWKNRKEHTLFNDEVEAVRIELKDLRELPKKYWYLGNNSFLLPGFFNFHYLLFGRLSDERWFIGVPGVYQRQERVMASIFGFPGFFLTQKDAVLQTASCEEMKEHQPGIWYHVLEE